MEEWQKWVIKYFFKKKQAITSYWYKQTKGTERIGKGHLFFIQGDTLLKKEGILETENQSSKLPK